MGIEDEIARLLDAEIARLTEVRERLKAPTEGFYPSKKAPQTMGNPAEVAQDIESATPGNGRRKRGAMSAAARKRLSQSAKKRWAEAKKRGQTRL